MCSTGPEVGASGSSRDLLLNMGIDSYCHNYVVTFSLPADLSGQSLSYS